MVRIAPVRRRGHPLSKSRTTAPRKNSGEFGSLSRAILRSPYITVIYDGPHYSPARAGSFRAGDTDARPQRSKLACSRSKAWTLAKAPHSR